MNLTQNCQFAKFAKFISRENLKFWNHGNQALGWPGKTNSREILTKRQNEFFWQ